VFQFRLSFFAFHYSIFHFFFQINFNLQKNLVPAFLYRQYKKETLEDLCRTKEAQQAALTCPLH